MAENFDKYDPDYETAIEHEARRRELIELHQRQGYARRRSAADHIKDRFR